jgi:hypothetical protein
MVCEVQTQAQASRRAPHPLSTLRERVPEIAILGGTPAMHYRARTYFAELGRFLQPDMLNVRFKDFG